MGNDQISNKEESDCQVIRRTVHSHKVLDNSDKWTQTDTVPTMYTLRSTTSRIKFLLVGIFILAVYIFTVEPPTPPEIPDNIQINIEDIEKELQDVHVRQDVEFDSPFDDEFFYGRKVVGKKKHRLDLKGVERQREVVQEVNKKIVKKYNEVWTWADTKITREELFPEDDNVDVVLEGLAKAAIVHVDVLGAGDYESGTSEKWLVSLEGGQKALMKIVWEEKGKMKKGGLCNLGFEMPTSEIAAFHLHRIIGFRNTPYVVGRKVDLVKDVLPVATAQVRNQIRFESNNSKTPCLFSMCYFCKKEEKLCPPGGIVEASFAYWIPRPLKLYTYPPGYMPYSTPRMDEWGKYGFNNKTYCEKIKDIRPYQSPWYYDDIFDFAVIDTLMFHYDTKHYVIYDDSTARGLTVRLDHGRAFCASDKDEEHIFLAPVTQCCTIRKSTYEKLVAIKHGAILTKRLQKALDKDPLSPVLDRVWFKAIERRLKIVLATLERCAKANGGVDKILKDG